MSGMMWDPFQQQVLAELGHVMYRQVGVVSAAETMHTARSPTNVDSIDDPMLARVARAAGMTVAAMQDRIGDMQVIAALRGNPAAKRALWPRLRGWRKPQG
jgi:hypothetical protein